MQTLRQIVSDLSTDVKALNLDDKISFRFLANKFRDKLQYFLRIDGRSREVLKHAGIWLPINRIDLEDVAVAPFEDQTGCYTLKRSVQQLPDIYATNYGLLVKVLTLNGLQELQQLAQSFDYDSYITREYSISKYAFWIENKYLYIPNVTWEAVKALVVPKDPIEVAKLNSSVPICTSPLEAELNYPEYLISLAKQEILKELAGVYKPTVEDEKGDDNTNRK